MIKTDALYKKQGRKYVPVSAYWAEDSRMDRLKAGTFRLMYAYNDGGARYEYDVIPDTAGFVAAAAIAKHAMCEMINEKSKASMSAPAMQYTKKQLAIIAEFRQKMIEAGGLLPTWWTHGTSYEIANAAIQTVREYRP